MPEYERERVVGRFPALVGRGLVDVLRDYRRVDILATQVDDDALVPVVAPGWRCRIAVVGESAANTLGEEESG
jgi:hypothetical protein